MYKVEEKVNQLLMFGFNGVNPPRDIGGIILFERNTKLKRRFFTPVAKIPQFVAIDQEGGRINRITRGVTILPPAKDIKNVSQAYRCGELLAKELLPLGINMDFAPVVDVNTSLRNPIIGDRSFARDPHHVAKLGVAMIRGMQKNGLIACAKHFPGHGPTKSDSHLCLPRVNLSKKEWEKIHLLPFVKAIKAGVKTIMVGHILYPALDKKYPASLSYKIITGWLRNKLGFKGLIITDDLYMGAIKKHYNLGEAAVMALEAGVDIILVCKGIRAQESVQNSLLKAVKKGRISEKRVDESVNRILKLKRYV